ncbi:TIGR02677 family protein [Actinacidiphila yanglinensis]|uniref:TIGR02677 family protein n=1 Tax=Actinacidiphila yanglinensis TaxID=310779 RepID=A0A1H6DKD0_9ACTN|nr:DUF2397 domain-containing protein [Actinacidiphila yanglinensis]SEG85253.1 TIGR02677 family protein [Actinacidiphila yanglinensis]SEG91059.1 TIGR02677 family protein [Actinacidiphila yanglinensis]
MRIDSSSAGGDGSAARRDLYRYATAEHALEYLLVMDLFTQSLLTDLSAAEVSERATDAGRALSVETAEERCLKLVRWGNLVSTTRDPRVPTVAALQRARNRFQASRLGVKVHHQVQDLLTAADGAREVARELLGSMVQLLDRIIGHASGSGETEPDALAADVTTVFSHHQIFTESVRDFYAYLSSVLSRYDLAGEEYSTFKTLLLEYVDLISSDVSRHAPAVADRLVRLRPLLPAVLKVLAALPGLVSADGSPVQQSPGRQLRDWQELTDWYSGQDGASGPAHLRAAAEQALSQLISNAKRMLATEGTGVPRRDDLLHLAALFQAAQAEEADRAFCAAFGAYPARHLSGGPEEPDPRVATSASWWETDPVDVPVSLRERGDRAARGRTSRVPAAGMAEAQLRAQAAAELAARQACAAELAAVGEVNGSRLSPGAREMLLDLISQAHSQHPTAQGPLEAVDAHLGVAVHIEHTPSRLTLVLSDDGRTLIHDLTLRTRAIGGGLASSDPAADGTGSSRSSAPPPGGDR